MTMKAVILLLILIRAHYVNGTATLGLPTSANCGNEVVLTCTSTNCTNGYRFLKNGVSIYTQSGPQTYIDPDKYNGTVISSSTVKLTITDIQFSDAGNYACVCGFDVTSAQQSMQYTCIASKSTAEIMSNKTLRISVDKLFPQPSDLSTNLTSPSTQLPGTYTCGPSSTLFHYSCTWLSTISLHDGSHNYTIMVTTGTQAVRVSGSFHIVTPTSPTIDNLVAISTNRQVLRGIEDIPLTFQCVSIGGIPAPTLAWYRGSTSSSPVAQTNTSDSVQQSDGTYTVTLTHNFTPRRADDLTSFLCRMFYPGATNEASLNPSPATALLYLDLMPDNPNVSQTGETVSGASMSLQCTSANGRPPPNITWFYRDQTFTPTYTLRYDSTSETYTVVSELKRPVSAVDNGQKATCRLLHTTLPSPRNVTVIVDVKFGPLNGSTTISGNQATVSNGIDKIRLNCTSGSSNPASNITWYNGSNIIASTSTQTIKAGNNNGLITSLLLTITPTRYMDGHNITCRTHNGYGVDSRHITLNVLYSPLIHSLVNITATEGEPDFSLACSASSKPPANFTWYKGTTTLISGTGTATDNSFSYVISHVNRTDAGSYICQAGNKIGIPDSKEIYVFVKYPPKVNVLTTTSWPYTITCTAVGYPENYTYQDWVQIWPGYGNVATIPFTDATLTLNNATYQNSGVYVCSASNGVSEYGTNVMNRNGTGTIRIYSPPVLTDPTPDGRNITVAGRLGHDAAIEIKYWSNVNDSVVSCYKLVGGIRSTNSSCSVTNTGSNVTLPVYNHKVTEAGILAKIKIHISGQEDMTNYDVVVSNRIHGESALSIVIVPQGPPEPPSIIGNFNITLGQVILTVLPGFHGGYNQTLVVQISTDLTTWINKTSVYIGLDRRATEIILVILRQNTLHHMRVFAYNTEGGSSNFSTIMNFTTTKGNDSTPESSSFNVALIVGAVSGVIVLVAVSMVVFVVCKQRKVNTRRQKGTDTRHSEEDSTSSAVVVECVMYESAGNIQPGSKKMKKTNTPAADVYAEVSKPKKGEKKNGKACVKDLYENAPKPAAKDVDNFSPVDLDVSRRTKKRANNDGLVYAELEFNRKHEKSVIHGLDDATTYVQVDFTRAADPLPDSDAEPNVEK